MSRVYVGMDVGSKTSTAVAVDERGKRINSEVFTTGARNAIRFLEGLKGEVNVLLEEGEMAGWLAREMRPHARSVIICDPKRNAWVAKAGNKRDLVDAAKLAELLRLGSYSQVWHPDDEELSAFKVVVQHYDECSKRAARLKCQIKARLRAQGVITRGQGVFRAEGRKKALEQVGSERAREVVAQEFRLLDQLERAKAEARGLLVETSRAFPVIRRLMGIPGVGPVGAARFAAYVGSHERFNRRTIVSYSCLGVVKRSSDGSPLGRERLSKAGNSVLKDVSRTAFERARAAKGPNGIKEFYALSLERTGDPVHARLNTQRKVLTMMLAIWRDETEYADQLVTGKAFTGA